MPEHNHKFPHEKDTRYKGIEKHIDKKVREAIHDVEHPLKEAFEKHFHSLAEPRELFNELFEEFPFFLNPTNFLIDVAISQGLKLAKNRFSRHRGEQRQQEAAAPVEENAYQGGATTLNAPSLKNVLAQSVGVTHINAQSVLLQAAHITASDSLASNDQDDVAEQVTQAILESKDPVKDTKPVVDAIHDLRHEFRNEHRQTEYEKDRSDREKKDTKSFQERELALLAKIVGIEHPDEATPGAVLTTVRDKLIHFGKDALEHLADSALGGLAFTGAPAAFKWLREKFGFADRGPMPSDYVLAGGHEGEPEKPITRATPKAEPMVDRGPMPSDYLMLGHQAEAGEAEVATAEVATEAEAVSKTSRFSKGLGLLGKGGSKLLKGLPLLAPAIDAIMGVSQRKKWGTSGIGAALGGALGGTDDTASIWSRMFWGGLKGAGVGSMFAGIGAIPGAIAGAIGGAIGGKHIAQFLDGIGGALKDGLGAVFSWLGKVIKEFFTPENIGKLAARVTIGLRDTLKSIGHGLGVFVNTLGSMFGSLWGFIQKAGKIAGDFTFFVQNPFQGWSAFKQDLADMGGAIGSGVSGAASFFSDYWSKASKSFHQEMQMNEHGERLAPKGMENSPSFKFNNAGNLRPPGATTGYAHFNTPEDGIRALRADLLTKMQGKSTHSHLTQQSTLLDLIKVFAPSKDGNNPHDYAVAVAKEMGISIMTPIGSLVNRVDELTRHVAKYENRAFYETYKDLFEKAGPITGMNNRGLTTETSLRSKLQKDAQHYEQKLAAAARNASSQNTKVQVNQSSNQNTYTMQTTRARVQDDTYLRAQNHVYSPL